MLPRRRLCIIKLSGCLTTAFLLSAMTSWAQAPTGEITGNVTDASGASVTDATITLTNTDTNAVRTAKSNTAGIYDFTSLPTGNYTLRAEMPGFAAELHSGIVLQIGQ